MLRRTLTLLMAQMLFVLGCQYPRDVHQIAEVGNETCFVNGEYRSTSGKVSRYVVFVPHHYLSSEPAPVILFLHGAGQTGHDGLAPIRGGLANAIRNRESNFPFITIFPQSELGSWSAESPDGMLAMQILEEVERRYNVDRDRVYLTGYSMGGEGTWSLAGAFPHRFAAIVPMTPGENERVISQIAHLPCWCFQGARDDSARVQRTRAMMLKLQKAGGLPIYEEFPELEHNCWDEAYGKEELYTWLLEHSLTR